MPSFGERLRQARESQNITLQEIAATTKISSRALQALESDQFDQLPGGIFNKGFVRAYARYVGLDEEEMLAAYTAAAKDSASETDMQTVSSQIAATRRPVKESRIGGTTVMSIVAVIVALGLGALWYREHRREVREQAAAMQAAQPSAPVAAAPPAVPSTPETVPSNPGVTTPGAMQGAVPGAKEEAGATPATNSALNPAPNATSPAMPGSPSSVGPPGAGKAPATAAPSPNANPTPNTTPNIAPGATPSTNSKTAPNPPVSPKNASPSQKPGPAANVLAPPVLKPEPAKDAAASAGQTAPVEVSISATQKAWISVTSDGKKLESLTLDPDNPELRSRSYKAQQKLKVVVGNAGGVTAVCNGKSQGTLGADGQAKTITFTSQGIVGR